jgi:hypothetical protein
MSRNQESPCRLSVILARKADQAVILRRGPTRWVRLILWHTDTDTFEPGQWFHGRIYARRCHLSPDGSLFIYFAANYRAVQMESSYTSTWTAISKPPYLTALALWPKGDAWCGGGLFINDKTVWLNHGACQSTPHPDHRPKRALRIVLNPEPRGEDLPIFTRRLELDGWVNTNQGIFPYGMGAVSSDPPTWQKENLREPGLYLVLRFFGYYIDHSGDPCLFTCALLRDVETPLDGIRWADWDHRGRLIFTRQGQLFAVNPEDFSSDIPPIADFNAQSFEPIEAPGWAKRW